MRPPSTIAGSVPARQQSHPRPLQRPVPGHALPGTPSGITMIAGTMCMPAVTVRGLDSRLPHRPALLKPRGNTSPATVRLLAPTWNTYLPAMMTSPPHSPGHTAGPACMIIAPRHITSTLASASQATTTPGPTRPPLGQSTSIADTDSWLFLVSVLTYLICYLESLIQTRKSLRAMWTILDV